MCFTLNSRISMKKLDILSDVYRWKKWVTMERSLNMHFFTWQIKSYSRTTVLKRMHMACAVEIHPETINWNTWIGKFNHNFCDEHGNVQKTGCHWRLQSAHGLCWQRGHRGY
jgi:hypothetical protein